MIKVEVIEEFSLNDFDKIKNIRRRRIDTYGYLYVGDTFECDKDMVEYLTGKNPKNKVVVKVIEVIPDVCQEEKNAKLVKVTLTEKPTKKKTSKK